MLDRRVSQAETASHSEPAWRQAGSRSGAALWFWFGFVFFGGVFLYFACLLHGHPTCAVDGVI